MFPFETMAANVRVGSQPSCGSKSLLLLAVGVGLVTGGCSTCRRSSSNVEPISPPAPYVRIVQSESNILELQIAARRMVPARRNGPIIWLTGVAHIGQSNYYSLLQQHLDSQKRVLFEGIGGDGAAPAKSSKLAEPAEPPPGQDAAARKAKLSSLQSTLADSLGLAFQLEAIDYDRPHFRSSDLSVEQIRELMAEPGASEDFNRLLGMMEGSSWLDGILQISLRFLGTNPRLQGMSKLILIEVLGQLEGDPSQLSGVSPGIQRMLEVLIAKRNEKVVSDLRGELKHARRRDSISVFYGTGHMPDLEDRLRRELNYRPADQVWFTAFSVDLQKAGISEAERQFIRGVIKRQLEQFQAETGR